jgi:hypothetical protein
MDCYLQIEFEKRLADFSVSYVRDKDDFYSITKYKGGEEKLTAQMILSLPVDNQILGSKNGNDIQAIGLFKFKFPLSRRKPDIIVFAFKNKLKNKAEFIIISSNEFIRRFIKNHPGSNQHKNIEMAFWLMDDRVVFDVTNISAEGEWFYLSQGVNGRMADGTDINYTAFLNNWTRLRL